MLRFHICFMNIQLLKQSSFMLEQTTSGSRPLELLKVDFNALINNLLDSYKHCITSGPLPSPRLGNVKFSRVRLLHIWLMGHCCALGVPYVDKFTAFWNRPTLFRHNGVHPNRFESHLMALNEYGTYAEVLQELTDTGWLRIILVLFHVVVRFL